MSTKQDIDGLLADWSESMKNAKVTILTKDKVLEIDHNFAPPIIREIKQEGKK